MSKSYIKLTDLKLSSSYIAITDATCKLVLVPALQIAHFLSFILSFVSASTSFSI